MYNHGITNQANRKNRPPSLNQLWNKWKKWRKEIIKENSLTAKNEIRQLKPATVRTSRGTVFMRIKKQKKSLEQQMLRCKIKGHRENIQSNTCSSNKNQRNIH